MADKKEPNQGVPENSRETEVQPRQTSAVKTILMIGIPLMLVQTALAYFLIAKFVVAPLAIAESDDSTSQEEDTPGQLHIVEDIIVNPAGTAGTRFLNATVALEYRDTVVGEELSEKDVQLRDILIGIFVAKTLEELDGQNDKENLRKEIQEKVNAVLKSGKVSRVYFTNFVMQ